MARSPADDWVLTALGWTAAKFMANPVVGTLLILNFRNNPMLTFRLMKLVGVETARFSGRMLLGTSRILAPSATASVEGAVADLGMTRGALRTGGTLSKVALPLAVVWTGVEMVQETRAKEARGDIGGETTLGGYVTEAEFTPKRRLRIHRLGGPGGMII
jgi:hypothetical protein